MTYHLKRRLQTVGWWYRIVDTIRVAIRASRVGVLLGLINRPVPLAVLYGGTDKHDHGYLRYYKHHLSRHRWQKLTIVEIGVGGPSGATIRYSDPRPGGSLAVWRDYFPRSRIIGVDIHYKDLHLGRRVEFVHANQASPDDLTQLLQHVGTPDIIIDDGSHVGAHVLTSFSCLFPRLASGGMYIIEDLATSYYERYGGGHPAPSETGVGLVQQLVNHVQAFDVTFSKVPEWGPGPDAGDLAASALHIYPGIAFIEKK